jgi:hypothetical protein
MNKKIVHRFQYNNKTGQWDIITTDSDFVEMNRESLAAMYRLAPEYRRQVVKTAETLREALIEEALERSDLSEANELIGWIKNGRSDSGTP